MNPLVMVLIAIAGMCGPRNQSPMQGPEVAQKAKQCQIDLLKCVNSKSSSPDSALQACILEGK